VQECRLRLKLLRIGPRCLGGEALFQSAESLFPSPAMVRKPGGVDHVQTARQLFLAKKAVVAPLPCSLRRHGAFQSASMARSLSLAPVKTSHFFIPHLHCVIPSSGLSPSRTPVDFRPAGFFLSVRVLSRLFRRLFLEYLPKAFDAGKMEFFSSLELLGDRSSFLDYLAPLREAEWVVCQAAFRRPRASLGLRWPLYPPRGDLQ
jgi:Putative transposase